MNNHPGLFTEHMDKFIVDDDDMDSDTVAESDMSLLSRSFLHSHGKELHRKFTFNQNTGKELTMKQMFDISEKLIVDNQLRFWSVSNQLGRFVNDEEVISLSHAKVYVFFRFCVMSWEGESEPNIKYCLGRKAELVQRFTTIQNFGHN